MPKPNIIFFYPDSMDGRAMGCVGHPAMRRATPNMDALASRGVTFRNCYSNDPVCVPSRSSMWTGTHTHTCEGWNNHKGLEPEDPIVTDLLEEDGYVVKRFGKVDFLSGRHTLRARLSAWTNRALIERPCYNHGAPSILDGDRERYHTGDWRTVDRAVDWLRNEGASGGKPFMLYLGINKPHPGFTAGERYMRMIDADRIEMSPPDETGHYSIQFTKIQENWKHGFDQDSVHRIRHIYLAMIAEVDAMLGHLMNAVRELGLDKNTYVIFASDHGETCFEHDLYYKMLPYEPSVRVPMIIAGPGIEAGRTADELVSLVDIYPTLADMTGLPKPDGLHGHSLMTEATGKPSVRPPHVLSECFDSAIPSGWFMVREGDWKYVLYYGYEPLLFNLKEDRWEVRNAAPTNPKKAAEMDRLLRSLVDVDEVIERNERYNKASFRRWRQIQMSAGNYEQLMALVFSGFDHLEPKDTQPWTAEDEAKIKAWMGET
jgi:arylsulfatase K